MDDRWFYGVLMIAALSGGTIGVTSVICDHQVELEAIRAGLVQDKDGRWVKPELKEPSP